MKQEKLNYWLAAAQYRKIVFTANIGGTEYTIDGSHDVFAPVADGTYTVTWTNAPSGVTAPNSTMVATITDTEAGVICQGEGLILAFKQLLRQRDEGARCNYWTRFLTVSH